MTSTCAVDVRRRDHLAVVSIPAAAKLRSLAAYRIDVATCDGYEADVRQIARDVGRVADAVRSDSDEADADTGHVCAAYAIVVVDPSALRTRV
jgi:hypothetical protein